MQFKNAYAGKRKVTKFFKSNIISSCTKVLKKIIPLLHNVFNIEDSFKIYTVTVKHHL